MTICVLLSESLHLFLAALLNYNTRMKNLRLYLLTLLFISMYSAYASSADLNLTHTYNLHAMEEILLSMKSLRQIPSFPNASTEEVVESQEEIPQDIREMFNEMQTFIFGNSGLIELKTYTDSNFFADFKNKTIYISLSDIQKIRNNKKLSNSNDVIRYILTHELSHFVHEISAHPPYSSKDFLTTSGLVSPYAPEEQLMQLSPEESFKSHAEVEIYAALVLKNTNFEGWNSVIQFINSQIQDELENPADKDLTDIIIADFKNRKKWVQEISKR